MSAADLVVVRLVHHTGRPPAETHVLGHWTYADLSITAVLGTPPIVDLYWSQEPTKHLLGWYTKTVQPALTQRLVELGDGIGTAVVVTPTAQQWAAFYANRN
jgi:hypothetical protein